MTSFVMFVREKRTCLVENHNWLQLALEGKHNSQMDSSKEIEYVDCEEDAPLIETFFDASRGRHASDRRRS